MSAEQLPIVSILIPIRNEAAYIERCLQAVLAQDYPLDRMEILIADGLSDDGTRAILTSLKKDHLPWFLKLCLREDQMPPDNNDGLLQRHSVLGFFPRLSSNTLRLY